MTHFFTVIFYQPLYNGLILLVNLIPWADAGIIVILFTFAVKLVLYPLSKSAVRTQLEMKKSEPEINAIKEKYKDNKTEQATQVLAFYREKKINPFSSIFLVLIQLPIIIALYRIFWNEGLSKIDGNLLYSVIKAPTDINLTFLGFFDISSRSLILAIIAGISAYLQARYSLPKVAPKQAGSSFKDDLARSMTIQAKYMLPVFMFFISYSVSAAVALYLITSNIFTIGQEIVIRRKYK